MVTVVSARRRALSGSTPRVRKPSANESERFARLRSSRSRTASLPAITARRQPREFSWSHARIEWPDRTVREGWLRSGDGMDFTADVAAEVAVRLARGEGKPGAYTPGQLFGPPLATDVGSTLVE
jgi:hypothetical protein